MGLAIKCDACGKLQAIRISVQEVNLCMVDYKSGKSIDKHYDLCDDCMRSLHGLIVANKLINYAIEKQKEVK